MNRKLKYIRKYFFLCLVLIRFWSCLKSQIYSIQSTMSEKSFPLGSPPLSEVLKSPLKVWLFDSVQTLQWKDHFKFRKQLPQQLGNCANVLLPTFYFSNLHHLKHTSPRTCWNISTRTTWTESAKSWSSEHTRQLRWSYGFTT